MSNNYDWTRFERQVFINAEPAEVWRAWTVPENIVKWFIATADYTTDEASPRPADDVVQAGDNYHWRWHQDLASNGRILEVVENERLSFTFGDKEPGSAEKIIVTVEVNQEDDGVTRLRLVQDNMADTPEAHAGWHLGCNLGWSFFMTNLKGLLEYGVDLRETDPQRAYDSRAVTH
jgi:uncharacterized protein YndB with AHSA1/START domain